MAPTHVRGRPSQEAMVCIAPQRLHNVNAGDAIGSEASTLYLEIYKPQSAEYAEYSPRSHRDTIGL